MTYHKLFNCQKCDAEIEINDPTYETRVRCRRCGGSYRLVYSEQALSWLLRAEPPVEPDSDVRSEDAPFSVLAEASRPALKRDKAYLGNQELPAIRVLEDRQPQRAST